ncbi:aldehyde dehydrogenase family protein [Ramlibacter sp.]|uniref:aldehyde dehydrogenase family protein n=1 Tax=Ramlibacter sp. TaxID=1917967 RepID=UPI003D114797
MTSTSRDLGRFDLDPHGLARMLSGRMYVDGDFTAPGGRETFAVHNPATGLEIGRAPEAGADDVDAAVQAARAAQRSWARTSARDRGKLLAEAARVLNGHVEELARLVALETGKALRTECRPEALATSDVFTFFGGLTPELKGETIPLKAGALTYTVREPIGVVGAIIPWNAPLMLMAFKVAPALAAGNTVVVKTAEEAPLGVLRVIQILGSVLPPGVLNVVSGHGPSTGAALVSHPDVKKVSFTGSVETGRIIYQAAAKKLVPVTLELGGKSPMIVLADADLDKAVAGAMAGMRFTRQGQSCTAASRMFVHESIHDEFVARLKAAADKLVIGDPLEESTDVGTIISKAQFDKVRSYIDLAKRDASCVLHTCSALPGNAALAHGYYLQPTLVTGVSNDSTLAREEIFGPVACVIRFGTFDEAIAMANDSDFGLAATVWTNDLKLAMEACARLEAGIVQVNQNQVAGPNLSYGGVKQSGLGKELSLESMLDHFTHKKTVVVNFE